MKFYNLIRLSMLYESVYKSVTREKLQLMLKFQYIILFACFGDKFF